MGQERYISDGSNVECPDIEALMVSAELPPPLKRRKISAKEVGIQEEPEISEEICAVLPHDFRWEDKEAERDVAGQTLRYVGGFIVSKLIKKRPLKDFTVYLGVRGRNNFVDKLSRGGLITIADWFYAELINLNQIVNTFNGNKINIEPGYLRNLREATKSIKIDSELIALFLRVKMYYRIKELNRLDIAERLRKANLRRLNKYTN